MKVFVGEKKNTKYKEKTSHYLDLPQSNDTCTLNHFSFHPFYGNINIKREISYAESKRGLSKQNQRGEIVLMGRKPVPKSLIAADKVPPVATRSSITIARSPGSTAPTCISRQSVPYSSSYASAITSPAYSAFWNTIKIRFLLKLLREQRGMNAPRRINLPAKRDFIRTVPQGNSHIKN
jgi:hypothetical protein